MITFKQFLAEAFDSVLPYRQVINSPSVVTFEFNNIEVTIANTPREGEGKIYIMGFKVIQQEKRSTKSAFDLQGNTKNAIKIYSTINKIMAEYFKKHITVGDIIKFDSYNARTNSIYDKFAKNLSKQLGMKYNRDDKQFMLLKEHYPDYQQS